MKKKWLSMMTGLLMAIMPLSFSHAQMLGAATLTQKPLSHSMQQGQDGPHLVYHKTFVYRVDRPQSSSGELIVLLHGSGGDETTLFSFARTIWPRASLVGIRGRLVQDGETRWFRKYTPTKFDQKDARQQADALVQFLNQHADDLDYQPNKVTFVGYSNGANLLAVMMMEHPDFVKRAILMRSMPVLDEMPNENLSRMKVLTIAGKQDVLYSPFSPALSALLKERGANVESYTVSGDHMIGADDQKIIERWIANENTDRVSVNSPRKKP